MGIGVKSSREKSGRPYEFEPEIRWPSNDEIWLLRTLPYNEWARRLGVTDLTVRMEFRRRGWDRFANASDLVRRAPCSVCGKPYFVGNDPWPLRECHAHRGDPEAIRVRFDQGEALTFREERALSVSRLIRKGVA